MVKKINYETKKPNPMTPLKTFNECLLNVKYMQILKSDRPATIFEILEFKKAVKIIKKENPIYNGK